MTNAIFGAYAAQRKAEEHGPPRCDFCGSTTAILGHYPAVSFRRVMYLYQRQMVMIACACHCPVPSKAEFATMAAVDPHFSLLEEDVLGDWAACRTCAEYLNDLSKHRERLIHRMFVLARKKFPRHDKATMAAVVSSLQAYEQHRKEW